MTKQNQETKEVLLIGTVHGDPDGMGRLLELLRKEGPALVAVEASPYGLAYRQRKSRQLWRVLRRRLRHMADAKGIHWKGWGPLQAIFAQIRFPFEYRASLRFCRDSGSRFCCIDSSHLSRHLIQSYWHELLDTKNIETLLRQPPEDLRRSVQKAYALASRLLNEEGQGSLSSFLRSWETDTEWQVRETALAEDVENKYASMDDGVLAYVGGWQHLLHPTDVGTLCDRLAHLHPRRVLLGD